MWDVAEKLYVKVHMGLYIEKKGHMPGPIYVPKTSELVFGSQMPW